MSKLTFTKTAPDYWIARDGDATATIRRYETESGSTWGYKWSVSRNGVVASYGDRPMPRLSDAKKSAAEYLREWRTDGFAPRSNVVNVYTSARRTVHDDHPGI